MAKTYKIHPAIGIARLGNSDEYYIAPETGGALPTEYSSSSPPHTFRDQSNKLLKQAARFKIFEYDGPDSPGKEVKAGAGGVKAIEWTVHLANKKACWYEFTQLSGSGTEGDPGYVDKSGKNLVPLRDFVEGKKTPAERQTLILDPGARSVRGPHQTAEFDLSPTTYPEVTGSLQPFPIKSLGKLETDPDGNLLVLAADGSSGTTNIDPKPGKGQAAYKYVITRYANNEGWFDDTADGPVTANLVLESGAAVDVEGAWCLCVPPKYAPQIFNQVTLYDTMYDIFVRGMGYRPDLYQGTLEKGEFNPDYEVDLDTEIRPILSRPALYQWVADLPPRGVGQHQTVKEDATLNDPEAFPYYILRSPENKNKAGLMPKLAGDNPISNDTISKYLTLTATQYFLLTQWKKGKIKKGQSTPPGPGEALDQGILENCVGGAFCPGIEMTWISRNPHLYAEPFRVRRAEVTGALSQTNGQHNLYAKGVEPGDLTKYMAQPWQADFNECSSQDITPDPASNGPSSPPFDLKNPYYDDLDVVYFWWWPAQRPFSVFPQDEAGQQLPWTRGFFDNTGPSLGDMQMVSNWKDMGFIKNLGSVEEPEFVEIERNTAAIEAYESPTVSDGGGRKPGV